MSPPTLYLDEDSCEHAVLNALRKAGYDVTSAVEEGRANQDISDQQQLEYASSEGRMLFSFNKQDYAPLHKKWFEQGCEHWGILLAEKQKSTTKSLISEIAKFLDIHRRGSPQPNISFVVLRDYVLKSIFSHLFQHFLLHQLWCS